MANHDEMSSDSRENDLDEDDFTEGHDSVSSENAGGDGAGGGESGDLMEDGFDMATHGGGQLEAVGGFDMSHALTEGFNPETVAITEEMEALQRSCDLEYAGDEPESVCGRDDRRRISPATSIPWRMICQLIMTRADNRQSRCTGWFIGPRTVMTAGHCVYSHSAGGWAKRIEVIPGMDASSRPYGSMVGTSFRSVSGWTKKKKPEYDYGAIILPNNTLGNRVGWFGFANLSSGSLRNLLANNSGYPGDKPFGTQWYNAGRITRVTSKRLYYMFDTAGGQSGSPVWRYKDGKRHAVGIHAYGGCPNKATRINKSVFDNMKKWKDLGS
ncbi:MAG: serine protease [Pseudomonadota bacterium]